MRVAGRVVAAVLLVSLAAGCRPNEAPPPEPVDVVEIELDAAVARAAEEGRPVFVHFTAEWCLPCKELKETVYPTPVVASRLARFVRAEVDIESPLGKVAARIHRVQTVPVLMTMTPKGEELRSLRVTGARSADELAITLDRALEQSGLEPLAAAPRMGDPAASRD